MNEEETEAKAAHNIIIVKRYKRKEESYHGGMWKIAYADFVTAMMAFFLLMWLINTISQEKLKGIAEYFTPAMGFKDAQGTGLHGGSDQRYIKGITTPHSSDKKDDKNKENEAMTNKNNLTGAFNDKSYTKVVSVMNNLEQSLEGSAELQKYMDNVMVTKSPEGIKIQIMDSINRSAFYSGTADLQPYMRKFLDVVANLIKNVPNHISIEGHTSSVFDKNSDQWTLSLNRADIIRKFLQPKLKTGQIIRVIGDADTQPFDLKDPDNPKNVRIVITLLNPEAVGKLQIAAPLQE